jgi:hypothetical protein
MRFPLFLIALSISDVAKNDLSGSMSVIIALFLLFAAMDIFELMISIKGR